MAFIFKDRQSTRPNRYEVTTDDGKTYYITLKRADEPTVPGTPVNAETFNKLVAEIENHTQAITKGGTGATSGATGLKNLFASGATVLSSYQYGDTLPSAGTPGRVFFKKVGS
jgi:hypothetical protein